MTPGLHLALKHLLLPPGGLLIVLLLALLAMARVRRLAWWVALAATLLLYLASTGLVAQALLRTLERYPPLPLADLPKDQAQAIVVLSAESSIGPEYGGTTVGPMTLVRLRYGARLHARTGLPMLVTGGYVMFDDRSLADAMSDVLRTDYGITDVWVERHSVDTWENAQNSAAILRNEGISSIYLVTTAWHMPRAVKAFEHAGLRVTAAPTGFTPNPTWDWLAFLPMAKALEGTYYALYEIVGGLVYDYAYERGMPADEFAAFTREAI